MSKKELTEQEYKEKKLELDSKVFEMMSKAEGAKHNKYIQKSLKAMMEGARLSKEYESQHSRKPSDDNYYDDDL